MSLPSTNHPVLDTTGEYCGIMQSEDNMWFLTNTLEGGSVNRNCEIPNGRSIFVPVLVGECDYLTDPSIKDESGLRTCAWSFIKDATLTLSVDGKKLDIKNFGFSSGLFNLTLRNDNPYGAGLPSGTTQSVAVGYYAILKPLSPGNHTIEFSSVVLDNPTLSTYAFAENVRYNIIVK